MASRETRCRRKKVCDDSIRRLDWCSACKKALTQPEDAARLTPTGGEPHVYSKAELATMDCPLPPEPIGCGLRNGNEILPGIWPDEHFARDAAPDGYEPFDLFDRPAAPPPPGGEPVANDCRCESYERLIELCWQAVREGLGPGAYREHKFSLHQAIAHRVAAPPPAPLRAALEWYANPENWGEDSWGVRAVVQPPEYGDPGKMARAALAGASPDLALAEQWFTSGALRNAARAVLHALRGELEAARACQAAACGPDPLRADLEAAWWRTRAVALAMARQISDEREVQRIIGEMYKAANDPAALAGAAREPETCEKTEVGVKTPCWLSRMDDPTSWCDYCKRARGQTC